MSKQQKLVGRSTPTAPSRAGGGQGTTRLTPPGSSTFDLPRRVYYESRCRVCTHPDVAQIEQRLAEGVNRVLLADVLAKSHPETAPLPPPSKKSLSRHAKRHMPMTVATELVLAEQAAVEAGIDVAEVGSIVTPYSVLAMVMRKGFADILQGRAQPELKDVMKAAELLMRIEADSDGAVGQAEVVMESLRASIELAQAYIDPADLPAYIADLEARSPMLQEMRRKADGAVMELPAADAWESADSWDNDDVDDDDDEADDDAVVVY